jgi:hypothetical protein
MRQHCSQSWTQQQLQRRQQPRLRRQQLAASWPVVHPPQHWPLPRCHSLSLQPPLSLQWLPLLPAKTHQQLSQKQDQRSRQVATANLSSRESA